MSAKIKGRFLRRVGVTGSFAPLLILSAAFMMGVTGVMGQTARKSATVPKGAAQRFDPEGEFNVEGRLPRALSEISTIQLLRDARRSFQNPHSGLYTNRGVTYRFKTVSVARERFTFTTVALDGTSYSFSGRFLRGGVFAELDSDQWGKIILEGQLTKLKAGRKAASANLKFSYFGGT
ncbi:MAG TPA: hypothetical protein VF544_06495 [Pyrinomonadaceae bacterium]|jgi:hypothetical protein